MKRFALLLSLPMILMTVPALADGGGDCRDGECRPRTREVCFNVHCTFQNRRAPDGFKSCELHAVFDKKVTLGGGEVRDDSEGRDNPDVQVTCDGMTVFNNNARRFTDLLGTRIQGETGPFPALLLPRGALHTGGPGSAGSHYSPAVLELNDGGDWLRSEGTCFIWTGNP